MAQLEHEVNLFFADPAERMMVKLYMDYYDVEEIARFAGVGVQAVHEVITRWEYRAG